MATQTETAPASASKPELTIVNRVGTIPLVAFSIDALTQTINHYSLTRSSYALAQQVSKYALSCTEPIQKQFAPIIIRADQIANQGFDAVESRFPYPFHATPEDIVKEVKGRSDHAYATANKTIDEKVRTPAYNVAQGIDTRMTPLVDYFAATVNKLHPNGTADKSAASPDVHFQYQRAYILSKDLRDQLLTYSADQVNQLRTQNALVQRASATAQSVTELASSSVAAAQLRVQTMSDTMVSELQRVQASTSQLPAALQTSFQDISASLGSTINDLSAIITSQDPVPEKVNKIRDTVASRVTPILDATTARVQEMLNAVKTKKPENGPTTNGVNGTANGHA